MKNLPVNGLLLLPTLQMRAALDTETINEYAEAMRAGASFPPILVVEADEGWLVCDGFHRVSAARAAGIESLPCEVSKGTFDDALMLALPANGANGLRRSNADKRRSVTVALERWPEKSDRAIAQLCGVDHKMVGPLRPALGESPNAPATRTTSDGRQYPAQRAKLTNTGSPDASTNTSEKTRPAPTSQQSTKPAPADDDDAPTLEELVDELQADNAKLTAEIQAAEADDLAAEAVKWRRIAANADRQLSEAMDKAAASQKREKWAVDQLRRCGRAVGVDDPRKIAAAVEKAVALKAAA